MLYSRGKAESKLPPAGTPEPTVEEEPEVEVEEGEPLDEEPGEELEYEETPDGKGLKPKGVDLIADDDRLMRFLEEDIEVLEREQEAEERRVDENW